MTGVTASRAAGRSLGRAFLAMTVTTGVSQSIVLLFPELLHDFGWSRTVLSVAPALAGAIGAMGGLAIGLTLLGNVPNTILVSGWFKEKQGLAMGVLYVGKLVGQIIAPCITNSPDSCPPLRPGPLPR
jgi:hypothetical protein